MKYVRIGNDIGVKWNIFRNYAPENLKNVDAKVYLFDRNGRQQVFNYIIEDGYIQGTFYGKDQVTTGNYRLVLTENEGNKEMVTLDYIDAFVLSAKLKNMTQSGEDAAIGINTDVVELSSTISTGNISGDLKDYVKREELEMYAKVTDLESYAKTVDLESYALKTDIPDTSNFATKDEIVPAYDDTEVRNLIDSKQYKLSESQIANLNADHSKYLTEHQTLPDYSSTYAPLQHVHNEYAPLEHTHDQYAKATDLQSYVTKNYLDAASYITAEQVTHPDYSSTYAPLVHTHDQYLTEHQDLSAYVKTTDLQSYALKTELFSKDYNDLTNKPTIPSEYNDTEVRNLIAGKQDKLTESQIANLNADHSKYLTEHQDLSNYALKTDIPDTSNFATKDEIVPAYDDTNVLSRLDSIEETLGNAYTISENILKA